MKTCSFTLALLMVLFHVSPVAANEAVEPFRLDVPESFLFEHYQELYLYRLDLRGLKQREWDEDEEDYEEEQLAEEVLQDLAEILYRQFSQHFSRHIPLNEGQDIDPSRAGLVLDLEVSGVIPLPEDRGRIMEYFLPDHDNKIPVDVHVHVVLSDSRGQERIGTFSGTQRLVFADTEHFLQNQKDRETFVFAAGKWARMLLSEFMLKK